jgi:hypothetical protein
MVQWGPFNPPPAPVAKGQPRPELRRSPKPKRSSGQAVYFGAAMVGAMLVFGSYHLFFHSPSPERTAAREVPAAPPRSPTIGRIVVTEGDSCIKKEYDNVTGSLTVAGDGTCNMPNVSGQGGPSQYQMPGNRLEQVRKGFLKQQ